MGIAMIIAVTIIIIVLVGAFIANKELNIVKSVAGCTKDVDCPHGLTCTGGLCT